MAMKEASWYMRHKENNLGEGNMCNGNMKLCNYVCKQNSVEKFEELIGFMKWLMNLVAFHLATEKHSWQRGDVYRVQI